jgi:hypothetical protein
MWMAELTLLPRARSTTAWRVTISRRAHSTCPSTGPTPFARAIESARNPSLGRSRAFAVAEANGTATHAGFHCHPVKPITHAHPCNDGLGVPATAIREALC